MKTRKIDNAIERKIVTGMIVSDRYLKSVQPIYHHDLIAIPFAKTVASWCLDYYARYGRAPERHVADIFEAERRNGLPDEQANLIEDFLADISDEYAHAEAGKFNVDYLLDQTEQRFEARNQQLLIQDVEALHDNGDFQAAEHLLIDYKKVQRPASSGIEPLIDENAICSAFDDTDNVLFRLPGALGNLVGPIEREDFVGILGPEKRGKTWRLQDLSMRALRAGCNVAYFDAGDMSEKQVVRRLHTRNTGLSPKYWGRMKSPVIDCAYSQDDTCRKRGRLSRTGCTEEVLTDGKLVRQRIAYEELRGYVPCAVCMRDDPRDFKGAVWYETIETERLTWQHAYKVGTHNAERNRKRFKLSCHANSTLTVRGMEDVLDMWEATEGFVADVVVADYFDIFAPENPKVVDERQKQNETWKAGRRLTQERHCALITGTQADADSYGKKSIREKNFSEDKRKYGHATRFMTLNQTPEEKRDMVIRIGTMFVREDDYDIREEAVVLQNLRLGQPYLGSYKA